MEYHTPTHSTRRGRQSLSYSSTPLYKVIMIFNMLMNIVTSVIDALSAETPIRIAIFSYFLTAYLLVAIAVVVVRIIRKLKPDESDQRKTSSRTKCVDATLNFFFTDLSLILAGVLYLTGDNILIIYRSFDATVPIGKETLNARDLRSYIVAFSLAFMIIAQIGPFLARRISEYIEPLREMTLVVEFESCESAQTNGTEFWENMRQATLYIPPGHHTDWKTGKNLILRHELPSAICDEQQFSKIRLTNSSCYYVIVDLNFFGKSKDFVHVSEIKVNIPKLGSTSNQNTSTPAPHTPTQHTGVTILYGKDPKLTFKTNKLTKCAWSAEFQILLADESDVDSSDYSMEFQKNPFQVKYEPKIASEYLIQACFGLLDYALIADALYTTMLDEITQQDDVKTGKNCPLVHQIVALILLSLIVITWVIVVIAVLPIGFCGIGENIKINSRPNKCEEFMKQVIGATSILKPSNLKFHCQLIKAISSDVSFCNSHKNRSLVSVIIVAVILYAAVFSIPLFIAVIVVIIASIFIILILGRILLMCCFFSYCSTSCQRLCVCLITLASVLIMTIYLPIYLIADNSWPWICWVDRATWKLAGALPLNVVATLISTIPIFYKILTFVKPTHQPDKQNEDQQDKQIEKYVRCKYTHKEVRQESSLNNRNS